TQVLRQALEPQNYDAAIAEARHLKAIDVADALAQLPIAAEAWALLQRMPNRAEVFEYFDPEQQIKLANEAPRGGLAPLVGEMAADSRAALYKRLNKKQQIALLPALAQAKRDDVRKLAAYKEGTAGAIMTSAYATLKPDMSVSDALVALPDEAPDAVRIYYAFVIDDASRLVGLVSVKALLLASPLPPVQQLMVHSVIHAEVTTDQQHVALLIARYHL